MSATPGATPGDGGTTKKAHYDAFVAAKARTVELDSSLSIKLYYRLANNLLKQASIYRDENNVLDLYINLLRFTSLVTETIPRHRDYHLYFELKVEYRKRLNQIVNELEELKPQVLKHTEHMNSGRQDAVLPKNSQNAANYISLARPPSLRNQPNLVNELEELKPQVLMQIEHMNSGRQDAVLPKNYQYAANYISLARPPSLRNQPNLNSNIQKDYGLNSSSGRRDYLNRPSNAESPVFSPSYLDDSTSSVSLSIPRAKDETLARHSIPGYAGQTIRRSPARPSKVQYPHSTETTPVELPSLQKALQAVKLSTGVPSVDSSLEASCSIWPKSETLFTTDPNLLSLHRQPSPPSVKASVHMLPMVEQSNTQLRPSEVADPRPGPPRVPDFRFPDTKRRKNLHISSRMLEEFLKLASINTQNNLETCGVLTGYLKKGVFNITTLIIPKQKSTPDTCETLNEEELFNIQEQRGLFQLGWIHTHPKQTCFMSSVDLHTHYSYQVMLPEAIAIVMAPTDMHRKIGIFRLSDPGGVQVLQNCTRRGFHQHEKPLEGGPIYEDSSHVYWVNNVKYDVIDLR